MSRSTPRASMSHTTARSYRGDLHKQGELGVLVSLDLYVADRTA